MRTTLTIDDDLLAAAKCLAHTKSISIGRALSDLARRGLNATPRALSKTANGFPVFRVPPGATGRWQVSGRNDTSYDSRVAMDTSYVQEWTFWEDLKIILKTPTAVLSRKGSY